MHSLRRGRQRIPGFKGQLEGRILRYHTFSTDPRCDVGEREEGQAIRTGVHPLLGRPAVSEQSSGQYVARVPGPPRKKMGTQVAAPAAPH